MLFPFTLRYFSALELFFVNSIGMPFNSGSIIAALLLIGLFYFGINYTHKKQLVGANTLILSVLFIMIVFSSWLMLIYAPNSGWSNSVLGFTAPAYTPIIWLVGLSLLVESYYFKQKYSKWHFILPSVAFSIFHVSHTVYVYNRIY